MKLSPHLADQLPGVHFNLLLSTSIHLTLAPSTVISSSYRTSIVNELIDLLGFKSRSWLLKSELYIDLTNIVLYPSEPVSTSETPENLIESQRLSGWLALHGIEKSAL